MYIYNFSELKCIPLLNNMLSLQDVKVIFPGNMIRWFVKVRVYSHMYFSKDKYIIHIVSIYKIHYVKVVMFANIGVY